METNHAARTPYLALAPALFTSLAALTSLAAVTLSSSAAAQAPTPVLVKDIRTTPPVGPSSTPQDFVTAGVFIYFTATTDATGRELYRSVAAANATLVSDVYPGASSSNPENITPVGTNVYFTADDGTNGTELWITDGTSAGTRMVRDINLGAGDGSVEHLTEVNGKLYFAADDGLTGSELWVSDGTTLGTLLVRDINPGTGNSNPEYLVAYNNSLIFAANDGVNGTEPWISDGTLLGTMMITDINVGFSSVPQDLTVFNGFVYFSASNGPTGGNGFELWRTDGTAAGTTMFVDLRTGSTSIGSFPSDLTVAGGKLYFAANGDSTTTTSTGTEPWVTDGTVAGTVLLGDLNVGTGSSISSSAPPQFTAVNSNVFFVATGTAGTSTTGVELFVTNGTASSAILVQDIRSGSSSSNPDHLTAIGSLLLFAANDGTNGEELWVSDGTTAGTNLAFDFNPGSASAAPTDIESIGGNRAIVGLNNGVIGSEPWNTDGTLAGTTLVADIHVGDPNASLGSTPVFITDLAGTMYFRALDDTNGNELWKSDGTAAGTVLVADINPGSASSTPANFTLNGNTLYFTANDGTTGIELYRTNGTAVGTVRLGEIRPGTSSPGIAEMVMMGGKLYFDANDGTNGNELWVSDGSAAGTQMLKDINPGSASSNPTHLIATGNTVFFVANDGTSGTELWKTDGTTAGTVMVADVRSGSLSGLSTTSSRAPVLLDGKLYFAATGNNGVELWVSDGTTAGTMELADINTGSSSSTPSNLTRVGDRIFFSANNGVVGTELWMTDGTALGTLLVDDLNLGTGSASYSNFTALGDDRLFFRANYNGTPTTVGSEPFISDGTAVGTFLLQDINSGTASSNPNFPVAIGSRYVYFNASDGSASGQHGAEVWRTDGTTAGTVRVTDLNPGPQSSSPNYFTVSDGILYFHADNGVTGDELYSLEIGASAQPAGRGCHAFGQLPILTITDPVLGGQAVVEVTNAPPSAPGLSLLGFQGPIAELGFGCNIHVDLNRPYVELPFTTDAMGRWTTTVNVPNDPSLDGLTLIWQSGIHKAGNPPISTVLTNAVVVTAGN